MNWSRIGVIRLRPSIVMLFIAMVLPVFSAALWVSYVSNDRMARQTANQTVERARLETIAQTEALLNPMAAMGLSSASVCAMVSSRARSTVCAAVWRAMRSLDT